jgi:hypothetical protein
MQCALENKYAACSVPLKTIMQHAVYGRKVLHPLAFKSILTFKGKGGGVLAQNVLSNR